MVSAFIRRSKARRPRVSRAARKLRRRAHTRMARRLMPFVSGGFALHLLWRAGRRREVTSVTGVDSSRSSAPKCAEKKPLTARNWSGSVTPFDCCAITPRQPRLIARSSRTRQLRYQRDLDKALRLQELNTAAMKMLRPIALAPAFHVARTSWSGRRRRPRRPQRPAPDREPGSVERPSNPAECAKRAICSA